ncbi:MAG: 4a-hydroxytetrahydrobiopterin dehydratase [Bacteroidales bacterium]|jgi:4a-hydroxytetrahydrobiopterin dehydratase
MKSLSKEEIIKYLSNKLKSWTFNDTAIRRDIEFRNFVEAFSFMTSIALEAEKMDHHPEWINSYNRVSIALNTHSAKGVTKKDFELAEKIDEIYNKFN